MESSAKYKTLGMFTKDYGVLRTIEEITKDITRGSGGSSKENVRTSWVKHEALRQLEQLAKQNNAWIEDFIPLTDELGIIDHGTENIVYLSKDGEKVIKLNSFFFLNDDNLEFEFTRDFDYFFNRIDLHNILFPEVAYNVLGFANNEKREVSVLLEQPFVRDAKFSTQEEIDCCLEEQGFDKKILGKGLNKGLKGFSNGRIEITDAKPQNVLKDHKDNLYFIDLDICLSI